MQITQHEFMNEKKWSDFKEMVLVNTWKLKPAFFNKKGNI